MYRGEEISSLEEAVAIMGSCSNAGKLHSVIPEPVFVNLLRCPGIDPSLAGRYDKPYLSYRPRQVT
jgi:hypothetical protein